MIKDAYNTWARRDLAKHPWASVVWNTSDMEDAVKARLIKALRLGYLGSNSGPAVEWFAALTENTAIRDVRIGPTYFQFSSDDDNPLPPALKESIRNVVRLDVVKQRMSDTGPKTRNRWVGPSDDEVEEIANDAAERGYHYFVNTGKNNLLDLKERIAEVVAPTLAERLALIERIEAGMSITFTPRRV